MSVDHKALMKMAMDARYRAYAPYSNFQVGAALLGKSGKVYTGCNIENASYSATNCAERTALYKAVSEGEREFAAIAVSGGEAGEKGDEPCPPCGVCRQVLAEFCEGDLEVILAAGDGNCRIYQLKDLLPMAFGKEIL